MEPVSLQAADNLKTFYWLKSNVVKSLVVGRNLPDIAEVYFDEKLKKNVNKKAISKF